MNFRIFENPRREIFHKEKYFPRDSEKSPHGNVFPRGFADPGGDFDLCRGIISRLS